MDDAGWVCLWRKLVDSRVWNHPDPWLLKVWIWCLIQARYKDVPGDGQVRRGQLSLRRNGAASALGMSPSKLYRCLQTFANWGMVTLEANNRFTVVTLCNWQTYQPCLDALWTASEQPVDSQWTASEQPTLLEEGKKARTGAAAPRPPRAPFVAPTVAEVAAYCRQRQNRVDAQAFVAHYESNGWKVGRVPMRDWRAAVQTWERTEAAFATPAAAPPPESCAERVARVRRQREEAARERHNVDPDAARALREHRGARNG